MLTPEELDEARAEEAHRQTAHWRAGRSAEKALEVYRQLVVSNWTPPEPVDPDLLAAREWAKTTDMGSPALYDDGSYDTEPEIIGFLAGCTRGREGAKGLVDDLDVVRIILHAHQRTLQNASDTSYLKGGYDHTVGFTAAVAAYRAALASAKRGG